MRERWELNGCVYTIIVSGLCLRVGRMNEVAHIYMNAPNCACLYVCDRMCKRKKKPRVLKNIQNCAGAMHLKWLLVLTLNSIITTADKSNHYMQQNHKASIHHTYLHKGHWLSDSERWGRKGTNKYTTVSPLALGSYFMKSQFR